MKEERILHVLGKVDEKDIKEADPEEKIRRKKPAWKRWTAMAACGCIVAAVCFSLFSPRSGMAVSACACGTDEEIMAAGVVVNTGTISDTGEMTGHPLMFYLTGQDIETVRFSCKNQQINFMDWTEKRDEYGNAQNFTVAYGGDAGEYYYLTIDWVPDILIRELTDDPDSKIATLPEEMRQDIIVMEITFESGKTATKAITISLLDDGTFYAAFDDYEISETDTFINRPDSEAIPRGILYSQDDSLALNEEYPLDEAPVIENEYKDADPNEPEETVIPDSITFTGTIVDNVIESLAPVILVDVDENSALKYDKVLFELTEEQKEWEARVGTRVQIVCSDFFKETLPPVGSLISITEELPDDKVKTAEEAARAYYSDTVFEVVSLELKNQTENEIIFSVCVSKDGEVQEPNRTITLQLSNETWEVINEGY